MKSRIRNTASVAIALGCAALTGCANPPGGGVPHAIRADHQRPAGGLTTTRSRRWCAWATSPCPAATCRPRSRSIVRAHAADPRRKLPLEKLGRAFSIIGSHDEAAGAFRSLLEIDPASPIGLRGLGNAYLALNEPDLALPNLEAAVAVSRDASSYSSLGVALDMAGRHADAQDAYQNALEQSPTDLDVATNLAISLSLSDRHDEAVQLMRRTANAPAATIRHRQNLALIYGLANRTR